MSGGEVSGGAVSPGLPKRVLVTGASRGIGRAIARSLAAAGSSVLATGRDEEALAATCAEAPDAMRADPADLSTPGAAEALVARATEALGGLDGLVCAAGIARHTEVGGLAAPDLEAAFRVNAMAPVLLVQAAAPALAEAAGSAVLVSSTLAQRPAPGTLGYAMSKAALEAATKVLAAELAPAVRVNAVAPGVVDTAMVRQLQLAPGEAEPGPAERAARIEAQLEALALLHPLGLGRPDDVAQAVLQLLASRWMTGTVLTLDGGLTSR